MYDVVALGELLIDFTDNGVSPQGNILFESNPGGAPCNVLAMLSKLGKKTAFIGKVGNDIFGKLLRRTIEDAGICAQGLCSDGSANTTLAFVKTGEKGERDFSFFRNPGADMMLGVEDLKTELLQSTKVFHFGTLSMTHERVKAATLMAIDIAKNSGAMLTFDPNLRPALWRSMDEAREQMRYGASVCDVMKIEENELKFITGEKDVSAAITALRGDFPNIKLLLVTYGERGSEAHTGNKHAFCSAFVNDRTVDTTGAGDTFMGCCIAYLLDNPIDGLTESSLESMLRFANAAASIVTTRKGAIKAMPSNEEIIERLRR